MSIYIHNYVAERAFSVDSVSFIVHTQFSICQAGSVPSVCDLKAPQAPARLADGVTPSQFGVITDSTAYFREMKEDDEVQVLLKTCQTISANYNYCM